MTEKEKHLDAEQIDRLIRSGGVENIGPVESNEMEQARIHVEKCESCQKLVAMESGADQVLRALRQRVPSGAKKDCPPETQIRDLALRPQEAEDSEDLLTHVSECDHCGKILHRYTEIFRDEVTPEEESVLASLKTSQPDWQVGLARRLAASAAVPSREEQDFKSTRRTTDSYFYRNRWVFAVAAAVVICAASAGIVWYNRPPAVNRLLAEAYSERRTLELRIPGASFSQMRLTRGAQNSNMDRPTPLLEAETLIGKNLAKQPGSPEWLQAKGRADLLDGHPDAAKNLPTTGSHLRILEKH